MSLAFPKPERGERRRANIDTSALALSKEHFDRDGAFKSFVRSRPCLLSAWKNHECGGVTEFAHLTTGGRGIKGSDYHGVNLCSNHHTAAPGAFHKLGSVEAFDSVHGTNLWRTNAELLAEWARRLSK